MAAISLSSLLLCALLLKNLQAFQWQALELKELTILSVKAFSENEVFAAAVDDRAGSSILYSSDRGQTWEKIKTIGSNIDIAITADRSTLCGVGTKPYCMTLPEKGTEDSYHIKELPFKSTSRDVDSFGKAGIAITGIIGPDPISGKKVNGVAVASNMQYSSWKTFDTGLSMKDGYFATYGAFPSEDTWYVVSSSWPVINPEVSTILSGRVNIVPGDNFPDLKYEVLSLKPVDELAYVGAISKTEDGGKTWHKVYDTNRKYYFNQIHCSDEFHCLAIGEGSKASVVLLTKDGGKSWDTVLTLSSDYSLHGCHMISADEMWVSGGTVVRDSLRKRSLATADGGVNYAGIYYRSTDGGVNWNLMTADGYAYDLSFFNSETGYSAIFSKAYAGVTKLSL